MSVLPVPRKRLAARLRLSNAPFVVEPRVVPSPLMRGLIIVGSIVGALAIGALLLLATGNAPLSVYHQILDSSLGSTLAISQTLVQTTPLILTGLAAAVAYQLRVYNIGEDGQLLVGAICASGFALTIGKHLPGPILLISTLVAGVLGGALYAAAAGAGAAYLRTDVVISTLMLNYIALHLVSYLILGSHSLWRANVSGGGIPQGETLPSGTLLPHLFQQADIGILIAVAVAVGIWGLIKFTKWGYELRVIGDSPRAARYAGMSVGRKIVAVMFVSGALAGLAGAVQVTNVTQGLNPAGIDPGLGLGYTGIVVAALARLSPLATVPVAFLMAALLSAGPALEISGVPGAIVIVLQGLLLGLVAAGQFLLTYRIRRRTATKAL